MASKRCECAMPMNLGDDIPAGYTGAWVIPPGVDADAFLAAPLSEKFRVGRPVHAEWCHG